jgi:hypothetical protein
MTQITRALKLHKYVPDTTYDYLKSKTCLKKLLLYYKMNHFNRRCMLFIILAIIIIVAVILALKFFKKSTPENTCDCSKIFSPTKTSYFVKSYKGAYQGGGSNSTYCSASTSDGMYGGSCAGCCCITYCRENPSPTCSSQCPKA